MGTSDEIARIGPRSRLSEHLPFGNRREGHIRRDCLVEGLGGVRVRGKVGVGKGILRRSAGGLAILDLYHASFHAPALGGEPDQDLASGGGAMTNSGNCSRGAAAASRNAVVGHEAGVGHDELDAPDGHTQFFGGCLAQLSPRPLPAFHFAGHDGDGTVFSQVDARGDVASAPATAAASALLGQGGSDADGQEQPGAEELHK